MNDEEISGRLTWNICICSYEMCHHPRHLHTDKRHHRCKRHDAGGTSSVHLCCRTRWADSQKENIHFLCFKISLTIKPSLVIFCSFTTTECDDKSIIELNLCSWECFEDQIVELFLSLWRPLLKHLNMLLVFYWWGKQRLDLFKVLYGQQSKV